MKHKVKYTRKEYREEYLKSEEWINLRTLVMSTDPDCQCCGKKAHDAHHLVYRNIVDVRISDLLPVCRSCHEELHNAIDSEWISQKPCDLDLIRDKSITILKDEDYKKYKIWINQKHHLSESDQELIKQLSPMVMKKISGFTKKNIWYDSLDKVSFTGRQILQIQKLIKLHTLRKKEGLDKFVRKVKNKSIDDLSLKTLKGFKSR